MNEPVPSQTSQPVQPPDPQPVTPPVVSVVQTESVTKTSTSEVTPSTAPTIPPPPQNPASPHIASLNSKQPINKKKIAIIALIILVVIAVIVFIFLLLNKKETTNSKASPDIPLWCRNNSFKGTIDAPSTVNARADGSFSFTAVAPFEFDKVCATINERMDEVTIPGIPFATRDTNCEDPILSNNNCNVSVNWNGRYGSNPQTFTVSGQIKSGTSCRLYLLTILGVPSCAKGNVTVVKSIEQPTPTQPTLPTPTRVLPSPTGQPTPSSCPKPNAVTDIQVTCPLCQGVK